MESFRIAADALRVNRLRSVLTMFGVVVGVAAVVVLVAIGSGARDLVRTEIEGLGSNIIFVAPGELSFGSAPTISRMRLDDVGYLGRVTGDENAIAVALNSGETVRAATRRCSRASSGRTTTTATSSTGRCAAAGT
ncbi:ABC transporter permease [Actinomadura madurae]|nr:ABC transporter permease [Actinomadura madurae]MCP9982024.1 ABC transporter permease [Actinomadura madurae]MCQ0018261.1 ABC transporter permease [Actinomadura madurae]